MPTFDFMCEVCGSQARGWRKDRPPRFCCRTCRNKGMMGKRTKPIKQPITPEMHERIRAVYQGMTGRGQVNKLARELGLPRRKITQHAIQQGWVAKKHKTPDWTERELRILETSAHLCLERIQKNLKKAGFSRSVTGIVLKRKRMRFLKNLGGQSARGLAECFGVDVHCIMRWIRLGYLKARKRGTNRTERQGDHWYIKDMWVRDFIINCVDEIDFRKIDKYWVVDLLAGGYYGIGAMKIPGDTDYND